MKLFKREDLFIRTTQENIEPQTKRKWLPIAGAGAFILVVIIFLFFVDGSLLPKTDDTKYKNEQTVVLPMVAVSSLNPLISKDEDTYFISSLIYEGLFALDEHLSPTPMLAEKYTIDQKNKTITLTLRQGVVFQDGTPLKAEDVKYSIDAFKAAGIASLYQNEIDKIDKAKISSQDTIVITFKTNTDMSLDLLTFPILPKNQFDNIAGAIAKVSNFKPIGTGAYQYKSYDKTAQLILTANSQYYGQIPKNELAFQVLPNGLNYFNLLKASNLSLLISKDASRQSELSGEDVSVVDFTSNEVEYLGFNFSQLDLAKRSVRLAIATAINPQEIIDESYYGSGVVNSDLYYPGYMDSKKMKDPYVYEPTASEKYLNKAGYLDNNGDGFVETADGLPLTFRILVNDNNASRVLAANQLKDSLAKVGMIANVEIVDWNTYLAKLQTGDFDLYLGGMKLSQNMDLRSLLATGGQTNYLSYGNGKLDELLNNMCSGLTPTEMQKTYIEIRTILHDDMPYFCLLYKTYGAIKSPALIGEISPTFWNYYQGSESWYCRYEVMAQTNP